MRSPALTALAAAFLFTSHVSLFAQGSDPHVPRPNALTYTDFPKPWPFRNLVTPGQLTVAVTPDSPPGSFLNLETNKVDGWVIDIWQQVAADLGLRLELVNVDWASTLPGLASNRFDLGCAGAAWTAARLTSSDFLLTNPVLVTSAVGIARKDAKIMSLDTVANKVMGGVRGEIYFEVAKKKLHAAQAVEFPSTNEAVLALTNGQVDFVVMNKGQADYALAKSGGAGDLEMVPGPALAAFPESLCVNPRSPDLLTAMNLLLGNYRATGQLASWFLKYAKSTALIDQLPDSGY